MRDSFINIIGGILIGLVIGSFITAFRIAEELSKETTYIETDKTIIYTIKWERLKEEYE